MSARVALIGANGHGVSHRRAIAPWHDSGALELVALCDLAPVRDEVDAPVPATTRVFTGYRELLAATAVDAVVICTPPHTHLEIASAAARAGADLLLEKPPVLSMAEHHALAGVLAATGRVCQVGFQALGSAALSELTDAIAAGRLGQVTGIGAVGAWQRPDSYYRRAPWAGKREVFGRPSVDGALANPFAHAVMQCLAVAAAVAGRPISPVEVELERYRARPIEVDDTAVLRIRLDHGPPVVVAVTLCADVIEEPYLLMHADQAAVLAYTADRLRLPGDPAPREVPGRTPLLSNLLAHRSTPDTPLVAPLGRTAPFTEVVEVITAAPEPSTIDTPFRAVRGDVVTVPGVSDVLRRAAERMALPSELGAAWAASPWRTILETASTLQQTGG
jgi:predicted dehydrogenase